MDHLWQVALAVGGYFTVWAAWVVRSQYQMTERVSRIEEHLGTMNGQIAKNSEWIKNRQENPPWMTLLATMNDNLTRARFITQALLNDLNERRSERNLPSISFD